MRPCWQRCGWVGPEGVRVWEPASLFVEHLVAWVRKRCSVIFSSFPHCHLWKAGKLVSGSQKSLSWSWPSPAATFCSVGLAPDQVSIPELNLFVGAQVSLPRGYESQRPSHTPPHLTCGGMDEGKVAFPPAPCHLQRERELALGAWEWESWLALRPTN